jgi:hypothetical protein
MVAIKFNCNVDYKDKEAGSATTSEAGKRDEGPATPPSQEKRGNVTDTVQKGLKGIFGK